LLDPIAEYDHSDGIAVVGGFVYRGSALPALRGKYVFGDFSRGFSMPGGRLFWLDAEGALSDIFEFRLVPGDGSLDAFLLGFGEDERGELYATTSEMLGPIGSTGKVWRIVDGTQSRIEICHVPPGAPAEARTITVSGSSLPAHLSHGDPLGACE
jgi:hypothetical protein